jgi:hypothetical protein
MSFFESIPRPPPPEPARFEQPAWERSDAVIPGSVPGEVLLARTERAAVALGSVRAYPNGFEFTLNVRLRDEDEFGLGADPFERPWRRRDPQAAEDQLRLGILYADGRRAVTDGLSWPDDANESGELVLLPMGSGGGERSWDGDFWVHPLPPDGPVTFVASWLRYEMAEVRAELDGTAIRAAAGRAVILWPEAPPGDPHVGRRTQTLIADGPGESGAGPA